MLLLRTIGQAREPAVASGRSGAVQCEPTHPSDPLQDTPVRRPGLPFEQVPPIACIRTYLAPQTL